MLYESCPNFGIVFYGIFLECRVIRGLGQYFLRGPTVCRATYQPCFFISRLAGRLQRNVYNCRPNNTLCGANTAAPGEIRTTCNFQYFTCRSERVFPTSIKFVLICSIDTFSRNELFAAMNYLI